MDTRREFLKRAALLAGGASFFDGLPESIQKALAIAPAPGSTYLDAEHVVILMQENRSFDHCYGRLRGVRGFNDPRAITLPNQNKVWLQTNASGETYAPFRLNINDTKATWMSSLPHSWTNQVDARNGGKYDRWLDVKHSGHAEYAHMPLTLGYYDRTDIPFYYALADAFTVCDQNFCSSLTGTTPNRLFLWTGTIREDASATPRVRNEQLDYDRPASWTTFPERLEENGISWRVYQNEINLGTGLTGDEEAWLANFSDNPLEWFSQYNIRFSANYQRYRQERLRALPGEISTLEQELTAASGNVTEEQKLRKAIQSKNKQLATLTAEGDPGPFDRLPAREQALHKRAFTINTDDPHYRELDQFSYRDGDVTRTTSVPKGDVLHQFRTDVNTNQLPTVSWVVAPENFSDHPGAPWYGAWYLSEMLDILTKNPDVWKKTIFIVAYDENDGYFDHVPPFLPPHPDRTDTGRSSATIDTRDEHVSLEQEQKRPGRRNDRDDRDSPIGLGYRVPLIVASPWSRGGFVNSEVFDHTSVLQFLEGFLSQKTGKAIRETNISAWRRAICGDLTSTFRPYNGEPIALPAPVDKSAFIGRIHQAKFKDVPANFRPLQPDEIREINQQSPTDPGPSETAPTALMPRQEKGTRPACALPYQFTVDGQLQANPGRFSLTFAVQTDRFGKATAGTPFIVYDMSDHTVRNYAVAPGDQLTDSWPLTDRTDYHYRVYGPNGFFREFRGRSADGSLQIQVSDAVAKIGSSAELLVQLTNPTDRATPIDVVAHAYGHPSQHYALDRAGRSNGNVTHTIPLGNSAGWYDISVRIPDKPWFEQRYAGRIETGAVSLSDPVMGNEA